MANATKPVAEDIPADRAWKAGRRIYVRCGYKSQFNEGLRAIGAKWDPEVRALWVGSQKADQAMGLIRGAQERAERIDDVKARGHWVHVPYEHSKIRAEAKRLGGLYDGDRKEWAMPDAETQKTVSGMVRTARDQAEAARRAQEQQHSADDQRRAAQQRERVLAESGRTPTGEPDVSVTDVSTRVMNKATARESARPLGEVVRFRDGRRGVVVHVEVWFTNDEFASSACWHRETHDQAHWDLRHTLALVEPTDDERQADAERQVAEAGEAELASLMNDAEALTGYQYGSGWSTVSNTIGTITVKSPGFGSAHGGQIILTGDDRVIYQHPGWYDDFRRSEGTTSAPDVVAECGP